MNNNISLNDMLKNATERAKKRAGMSNEPKKGYSNWGDYPRDDSKSFDFQKTTESLTQKLNELSSTMSVKLSQSVSDLNDRVNEKKDVKAENSSETDLADAYPELKEEWNPEKYKENTVYDPLKYADVSEDEPKPNSFFTSQKIEGIMDSLMKASQKARESETYGKISRALDDARMSVSEAFDSGDYASATRIADTDGSNLFSDIKGSHSPVVVSGKAKGRVVQELSDTARRHSVDIEQIPMVLKDELSLRRLVAEVRDNEDKNRVVVLDIVESPNAEQLRIFEKFVEEAKNGAFYLVILSDDEFSNSWFVINGAIQRVYDF